MGIVLVGGGLFSFTVVAGLDGMGFSVKYGGIAYSVAVGIVGGIALGIAYSVTAGIMMGVMIGVIMFGVAGDVATDIALGIAFGIALGVVEGVALGAERSLAKSLVFGFMFGLAIGAKRESVMEGVMGGVASAIASLGAHSFVFGSLYMGFILGAVHAHPPWLTRLSKTLPYYHHDLIYLPLPGLHPFFLLAAKQDPALAQKLILDASITIGQKRPARLALVQLQAQSLEDAAVQRLWAKASKLDLPFSPALEDTEENSPLHRFAQAAQDLQAASLSSDLYRKQKQLQSASSILGSLQKALAFKHDPESIQHYITPVTGTWLKIIQNEIHSLEQEQRHYRPIPTAFEANLPIGQKDKELFKGRHDLVRIIDHDLADHRRAPFFLCGQRRVGKSSLLLMLPERLGSHTIVVWVNFQRLSGERHRLHPHRLIADKLYQEALKKCPQIPAPPADEAWGATLQWLQDLEAHHLGEYRILVTIDEVERLNPDPGTPSFDAQYQALLHTLDFLRAAGDTLRSIRMLMVGAYMLNRLGRAWTDRLISAIPREISYLEPEEARELMEHPIENFPPIYPEGGVERIFEQTRGQPYLIQFTCDCLVRDLNAKRAQRATLDDIEKALGAAMRDNQVFFDLWEDCRPEEQAALRSLAFDQELSPELEQALADLIRIHHIERKDGKLVIGIPLFRRWIRHEKEALNASPKPSHDLLPFS